jgi:hypothetical protein
MSAETRSDPPDLPTRIKQVQRTAGRTITTAAALVRDITAWDAPDDQGFVKLARNFVSLGARLVNLNAQVKAMATALGPVPPLRGYRDALVSALSVRRALARALKLPPDRGLEPDPKLNFLIRISRDMWRGEKVRGRKLRKLARSQDWLSLRFRERYAAVRSSLAELTGFKPALVMEMIDRDRELCEGLDLVGRLAGQPQAHAPSSGPPVPRHPGAVPTGRQSATDMQDIPPPPHLTAVERALVFFLRDPNQSVRAVARQVGCDPALLYRDQRFCRLREALKGKLPRGSRSKEGHLEAQEEE